MKSISFKSFLAVTGIMLAVSCSKNKTEPVTPTKPDVPKEPEVSAYLTKAKETHAFIKGNLQTPFNSYRINTTSTANEAYEWYIISQLYADVAMVKAGEADYKPYVKNTFDWVDGMRDKSMTDGGYFASARLDGTGAGGDKYVDDNGLTGMVFLDAYDIADDGSKAAYLNAAKNCAQWLIKSGLWDDTYGGGFWWSTAKQNKPTQSNGLTMQLFLRLYKITGEQTYLDWAVSVSNWLNSKMYDSATGLYVWMYQDGVKHTEIFTYDNAIMVEAYLCYYQATNNASYLSKAQAIGNAMNKTLWDKTYNVYIFNTKDIRVTPAWCGWGSQAMIKLYEADSNAAWLNFAKGNIDAINTVLRTSASGYYQFAGLNGAGRYANIEGVDVAWMQRLQAMIAKYK